MLTAAENQADVCAKNGGNAVVETAAVASQQQQPEQGCCRH